MSVPLYIVDAFTDRPFRGNPAAVCWLEEPRPAEWMQAVAAELNLSETAFLGPHPEGVSLRWFTPEVEVPLCGHATLASAHVLWETGRAAPDETIRFQSRTRELCARRVDRWIELDFPAFDSEAAEPTPALISALGVTPVESCRLPSDAMAEPNWILRLANEEAVRAARPDFAAMRAAGPDAVLITAESEASGTDMVSRYFAPSAGIDEDPVTGFAHCCLAPFWGERLGRHELVGFQASRRGGRVRVVWEGERARLQGEAVAIVEGALRA